MEDEFPFAAGVAGVDDTVDVLAFGEFEDLFEAGFRVRDGIEVEVLGDGGQDGEIPWQFFAIRAHRHAELDEVADSGSDDGVVVFKVNIPAGAVLFEFTERLGESAAEVGHDAGFFGNDQCFSHNESGPGCGCGLRD